MSQELTKDSDALICLLYKSYIENRKNGISKFEAKCFGGAKNIQEKIISKWSIEDTDETCRELDRAGYLDCFYSGDSISNATLSDEAIIYMESRFENDVVKVIDYLAKIKSVIPFI